jgi:head-tail adaptor
MLKSIINPSIGSGELTCSIQIQKPVTAPGDTFGQSITPDAWKTVLTVRAAIETSGASEINESAQLTSQAQHRITIRRPSVFVGPNYRVLWATRGATRVFNVQAVENVLERGLALVLFCNEVNQQS